MAFIAIEARQQRRHEEHAWLAWTTAALTRVKPQKFPRLTALLGRKKPKQTWEEQLALAKAWVKNTSKRTKGAPRE